MGKSWTFVLLHKLMRPIEALLRPNKNGLKKIHNFIDVNIVLNLPKIFYFNITDKASIKHFKDALYSQIYMFQLEKTKFLDGN